MNCHAVFHKHRVTAGAFYDKSLGVLARPSYTFAMSEKKNLMAFPHPPHPFIKKASDDLLCSAAGWRKVFALKGEQDTTAEVSKENLLIMAIAAFAFHDCFGNHEILIGTDSRPTGPALAQAACRTLVALGVTVHYCGIVAAPEIMARSSCDNLPFLYITASHNPVGHNGIKFGKDGGVLDAYNSHLLISRFQALVLNPIFCQQIHNLSAKQSAASFLLFLKNTQKEKQKTLQSYKLRVLETAFGQKWTIPLRQLQRALQKRPVGIVAEFNGSARAVSIDVELLEELGCSVHAMNDRPGDIVHGIVPEGANLNLCRVTLEELHRINNIWSLGYVPDNDGDRGNICFCNDSGTASALEAQEVFALLAYAELSEQRKLLGKDARLAIAVNGPTSLRIDEICKPLQVEVHRCEVGEANVVALADALRSSGATVRILGEGSNGGVIIHPSRVRDPLNTILSIHKMLGRCSSSLETILHSLPAFTTTGSYEPEGLMQIQTKDQKALKSAWEALFLAAWEEKRELLKSEFGIVRWKAYQTEGIQCREGLGNAKRPIGTGGLKIVFFNQAGEPTDSIWMRGSSTEAVFRVQADSKGKDKTRHDYLLQWHRSMIALADQNPEKN